MAFSDKIFQYTKQNPELSPLWILQLPLFVQSDFLCFAASCGLNCMESR